MAIADIPADGLTKALPKQRHEVFIKQLGMEDILEELLEALKRRLEELEGQ